MTALDTLQTSLRACMIKRASNRVYTRKEVSTDISQSIKINQGLQPFLTNYRRNSINDKLCPAECSHSHLVGTTFTSKLLKPNLTMFYLVSLMMRPYSFNWEGGGEGEEPPLSCPDTSNSFFVPAALLWSNLVPTRRAVNRNLQVVR